MSTPTPAERAQAKRLAYLHPGFSPGRVNAIAQALADARVEVTAEVTAKYEALADRWEARGEQALLASRAPGMNLGQHWHGMEIAAETKHYADQVREVSQ